ncbi:hypothetical protein HHK36_030655 [Tetracentron sinense]|uniref:Uncharacterized protein n=1 Tax=Tetracentron sinense TaxID=13715 RepID=A0A834YCY8_TETSI|nr:hypothetical protein HHK36_030655 [Tetracentron sinense]
MARALILFALCVLPALVSAARPTRNPFIVQGRVYCDTCRAGFETSATTYLPGNLSLSHTHTHIHTDAVLTSFVLSAKVRVECKDRDTLQLLYSIEGVTDSTGTYKILVSEDHEDQFCDAVLVSSPQDDCSSVDPGHDRARVILTRYNGIVSDNRFANSLGFMKDQAFSVCTQLLKQYKESEE